MIRLILFRILASSDPQSEDPGKVANCHKAGSFNKRNDVDKLSLLALFQITTKKLKVQTKDTNYKSLQQVPSTVSTNHTHEY